jgi:hypothetical protein
MTSSASVIAVLDIQDFIEGSFGWTVSEQNTRSRHLARRNYAGAASIPTDLSRVSSTIPLSIVTAPQIITACVGPRCEPM